MASCAKQVKLLSVRTLYLLRHATAPRAGEYTSDFDRRLNEQGLRDAGWIGRYLKSMNAHVDVALCSTALRARQTLDEISAKLQHPMRIFNDRTLYDTNTKDALRRLSSVPRDVETVLMVGHNPWIIDIVCALSPDGEARNSVMGNGYPPCGLTELRFNTNSWDIRRSTALSATFIHPQGSQSSN